MKSKAPIVPVALIDSYKVYNSWDIGGIKTQVHFLEPIFYDEYKDMNTHQIAELVKTKIAIKLKEITNQKEKNMIEIKFDKEKKQAVAYDNNIKIGECDYIETDQEWNIIHTEVSSLYQGQGIARKLVESITENAEKYNKNIIADCSYAKKVIENKK